MLISKILAWITVILCLFEAFKLFARLSKNKKLNKFFAKFHKETGIAVIITGLLHGMLAGNVKGMPIKIFTEFFKMNPGTLCFIITILLYDSYLARKMLKKHWLNLHRVLTLLAVVTVILHLFNVGITIQNDIFGSRSNKEIIAETVTDPQEQYTTEASSQKVETATQTTVANSDIFSGAVLKDGTYDGSSYGRNGAIRVRVTVNNGKVSDISILEHYETPSYFQFAKDVINRIISDQSLQVDSVTGATISSRAIKKAVYNALEQAVVSGNLIIN